MGNLAGVLAILCSSPLFARHCDALHQDEQLCSGLVQLLLPAISAMAVGLQLPPERRPPECTWCAAAQMSLFEAVTPFDPHADRQLVVAQPEAVQHLVAAAAQLLQHCPFPAPATANLEPYEAFETSLCFIYLLAAACRWHACSHGQQHEPAASAASAAARRAPPDRRLLQHLLALPPKLCEALAALAQDPCTDLEPSMIASLFTLDAALQTAQLLSAAAQPLSNTPGPVADLPAWCRAAAAVLRWLPAVAAMQTALEHTELQHSAAQRPGSPSHAAMADRVAQWPSPQTVLLCAVVSSHCVSSVQQAGAAWAAPSPVVQDNCLQALWQLHTMVCRLVHWLAAGRAPRMLPDLTWPLVLTQVLTHLLEASVHLCQAKASAASQPNAARCARSGVGQCVSSLGRCLTSGVPGDVVLILSGAAC